MFDDTFQYATQPEPISKVLDHGFKLFTASFSKVIGFSLTAAHHQLSTQFYYSRPQLS